MDNKVSIAKFIRAILQLPSDEPKVHPGIWYKTQKEHWLGWLSEYHGPGAYGRKVGIKRDAKFAYNHIVNHQMLLWLISAAGVSSKLVNAARRASAGVSTMQHKSASIRKQVPWEIVAIALWGLKR